MTTETERESGQEAPIISRIKCRHGMFLDECKLCDEIVPLENRVFDLQRDLAAFRAELAQRDEIIAASIALVPHLENGWDECDEENDQRAANEAVNRLIAAVKARAGPNEGTGMTCRLAKAVRALQAEPPAQGKEGR